MIAPHGGRDDYAALFHEGGHAEHYAHTDPELAFEFRMLGDNSVTESFAFLLQHLVEEPRWMRKRLGVEDPEAAVAHARAARLALLRRYAAKLAYELELHGGSAELREMPARYSALLERGATGALAARELAGGSLTRASMPPAICGPGRSSRSGGPRFASVTVGAGSSPRLRESGCGTCGGVDSDSTPKSCSPRPWESELDFGELAAAL